MRKICRREQRRVLKFWSFPVKGSPYCPAPSAHVTVGKRFEFGSSCPQNKFLLVSPLSATRYIDLGLQQQTMERERND